MFLHSRIADTSEGLVRRMEHRLKSSSDNHTSNYVFVWRRYWNSVGAICLLVHTCVVCAVDLKRSLQAQDDAGIPI